MSAAEPQSESAVGDQTLLQSGAGQCGEPERPQAESFLAFKARILKKVEEGRRAQPDLFGDVDSKLVVAQVLQLMSDADIMQLFDANLMNSYGVVCVCGAQGPIL